jgi:hypothetical protein
MAADGYLVHAAHAGHAALTAARVHVGQRYRPWRVFLRPMDVFSLVVRCLLATANGEARGCNWKCDKIWIFHLRRSGGDVPSQ